MDKLFICFTPLHALIVENIINKKIKSDRKFLLYISKGEAPQNLHYFNRIKNKFTSSEIIYMNKSFWLNFITLIKVINRFKRYGNDNEIDIYIANFKMILSRFILLFFKIGEFNTFDDGIGNISGRGYFYENESRIKRICCRLINKNLYYDQLRSDILNHYTIFKHVNVFHRYAKKSHYIRLEPSLYEIEINESDVANILLTGPFSENGFVSSEYEINLYNNIIEELKIDLRIRHPAEKLWKDDQLDCLTSKSFLIAEELILSLARYKKIQVYGFSSTALIIISNHTKINTNCLFWECEDFQKSSPNLFKDLGIEVISIEDLLKKKQEHKT